MCMRLFVHVFTKYSDKSDGECDIDQDYDSYSKKIILYHSKPVSIWAKVAALKYTAFKLVINNTNNIINIQRETLSSCV